MNLSRLKKIGILGLGKSGIAVAKLLLSLRKKVKISEKEPQEKYHPYLLNKLKEWNVECEFGGHTYEFLKEVELLVISPGVNLKEEKLSRIVEVMDIPIIGEAELCSWLLPPHLKVIAISGTNGKTTNSFLTYRVLKTRFKNTYLVGNIGIPFAYYLPYLKPKDIVVVEVSSFQLEGIVYFKPFIACLLNIEPDHLDRYICFKDYLNAKRALFKNQDDKDISLLNKEDRYTPYIHKDLKSRVVYFSYQESKSDYPAVLRIGEIMGIDEVIGERIITEFKGLPHRLQWVREIQGVSFINDSKATNPSSTLWALKKISAPLILIAGGKDKHLDYGIVKPYLHKVKKVNLIGEAAFKIREVVAKNTEVETFCSLEKAVKDAFSVAERGDTVLFSPMCSSFDMFSNYQERGNKFIELVKKL